ncbi:MULTISPECIES: DUF6671 family protein [Alphaproteobacteria]|jgi:hypothetical protein|uniref:DUF6671 domain-containing protein n=1 Tax=Sphingopyxis bauzanensis TaxID=651663 RepID=A0A246JRJ5_9SPHN|nr:MULTISPECIES: DUF6671 family protein [Sphingopyxis]KGB57722.1 hypothetical protein FG95_01677 [Sphingopyxis sp. LC363]OWQ95637.1 hypothetical protein CDQ92_12650 [Sphingopyxis bauzanensis]GGJ38683.1 hypothetical protein GCM10011393_06180 [Sphingopyxis bauzanensis]
MRPAVRPYDDELAVLATMHGKERVIHPLLKRALGLHVAVSRDIDTDWFGTFSRDVERTGTQIDAARAKISAAFAATPEATVAIASEGSFGPHPYIPFVPLAREIVMLADRTRGIEVIGYHACLETNFSHAVVSNVESALEFASRLQFPKHGLLVIGCRDGQPAPERVLLKDIADANDLTDAVERVVSICGTAFIETDMRAHRNPTRMRGIKRATLDLVRRYRSSCPVCAAPGFAVTRRLTGLPCSWCHGPTDAIRAEVMSCVLCDHRVERPMAAVSADPGSCGQCNP